MMPSVASFQVQNVPKIAAAAAAAVLHRSVLLGVSDDRKFHKG